jgi:ComF family protein
MLRKPSYSPHFAAYMAERVNSEIPAKFDVVVSVPTTREALARRGFDQAKDLAKHVAKILKVSYVKNALKKVKKTKAQKSLDFAGRQKNVVGAFDVVFSSQIKNKIILLVDDVFTTGATFSECAKVLKSAGASAVYCAAFARTGKDGASGEE